MSSALVSARPPILIASDDADIATLLQDVLRDEGYPTHWYRSGHDALAAMRDHPARCVVLLSLRWPPLHSRALLRVIAAEERLRRRHTCVLLTALWDMLSAEERALLQALGVPIVPKPFELAKLLEVVAQAATQLTDHEL